MHIVQHWRLSWQAGGYHRWLRALAPLLSGRTPLISFPQRRHPSGSPIVQLSIDYFHQRQSLPSAPSAGQSRSRPAHTELPPQYGRKPVSIEEMEVINSGGAS